jgi:hypothetical protein
VKKRSASKTDRELKAALTEHQTYKAARSIHATALRVEYGRRRAAATHLRRPQGVLGALARGHNALNLGRQPVGEKLGASAGRVSRQDDAL